MIKGWVENDRVNIVQLQKLPDKADKRLLQAMRAKAKELKARIRVNLGMTLKQQTGILRRSLFMKTRRTGNDQIKSYVGTAPRRGGYYGHFHEYGYTSRGGRPVKARPYATPAMAAMADSIREAMIKAVMDAAEDWDK